MAASFSTLLARIEDIMRICLVGTTHPSYNPRLVREADTLAEVGHYVRVVAPLYNLDSVENDDALMAHRSWRLERVDFLPRPGKRFRSRWIRGRRRLAHEIARRLPMPALAEQSYVLALPEMRELAACQPADWFIAHTQTALPVAAEAARRWNAHLGFDCEDLLAHSAGEPRDIVSAIEAKYVPRCTYVSTASVQMAEQLSRDHEARTPVVLYNVFPLVMAEDLRPPSQRSYRSTIRLHWFGQTIGPGRALEDAVLALPHLPAEVELHLRGNPSAGYRERLEALAGRERQRLFFLPPLEHDEVIRAMEPFDVGLALERPEDGNYSRTVTNKLFSYLLAGLAVAASDTPGQREAMSQIPAAGFLYPAGNVRALADGLLNWVRGRQSLRAAQQASWDAARARFCWDRECEKFLALFSSPAPRETVLAGRSTAS
jgi:glycosyltransferase involved in cell wall biosynthesis